MDAVDFLRGYRRYCRSHSDDCNSCEINLATHFCAVEQEAWSDRDIDSAVLFVQAWEEEHPVIINAKKFEEVFGFNPIGYVFRGEFSDAWWNQEYKEPKS